LDPCANDVIEYRAEMSCCLPSVADASSKITTNNKCKYSIPPCHVIKPDHNIERDKLCTDYKSINCHPLVSR
jgi:hypothetical protein